MWGLPKGKIFFHLPYLLSVDWVLTVSDVSFGVLAEVAVSISFRFCPIGPLQFVQQFFDQVPSQ
jgi:hypothetical protein